MRAKSLRNFLLILSGLSLSGLLTGLYFLNTKFSSEPHLSLSEYQLQKVVHTPLHLHLKQMKADPDHQTFYLYGNHLNPQKKETILIYKYRYDGSLDLSFGSQGSVEISDQTSDFWALDLAINSKGDLILLIKELNGNFIRNSLFRLDSQGNPDLHFFDNSRTSEPLVSGFNSHALILDKEDSIFVVGQRKKSNESVSILQKYLFYGLPDLKFANHGEYILPLQSGGENSLLLTSIHQQTVLLFFGSFNKTSSLGIFALNLDGTPAHFLFKNGLWTLPLPQNHFLKPVAILRASDQSLWLSYYQGLNAKIAHLTIHFLKTKDLLKVKETLSLSKNYQLQEEYDRFFLTEISKNTFLIQKNDRFLRASEISPYLTLAQRSLLPTKALMQEVYAQTDHLLINPWRGRANARPLVNDETVILNGKNTLWILKKKKSSVGNNV